MKSLFTFIGAFLLNFIFLPYYIAVTAIQTLVTCIAIFPIRFVSFFGFTGYRKSYKIWKTINIIILLIPFLVVTFSEFFVLLLELLITKTISTILHILPLLNIIPTFIFGLLTLLLVKFFEALQFALLLPDIIPFGASRYVQANPITINYPEIGGFNTKSV